MDEWIKQIASDAQNLGVQSGDTLLVHSSFKSLGVPGLSPVALIDGLRLAVGPHGTLVFPALSYLTCTEKSPIFHWKNTPSCVGIIPETFRALDGVVRSLSPTHSCCAQGPLAIELTALHQLDNTPCGKHSPVALLPKCNGKVLFIGCSTNCNTSMHAVEEEFTPPYLFAKTVTFTVTDPNEHTFLHSCYTHNFKNVKQQYQRVPLDMKSGVTKNKILGADCTLLDAKPMWAAARCALTKNPFALVNLL